jgi:hypothetical protein
MRIIRKPKKSHKKKTHKPPLITQNENKSDNYVIKLIDLERYKKDNGFYEVNLYPDREFDSEVHVLLYCKESWGNYQYFQYFKMMDKRNIKVIIYCIFTLFPLASIVGHEIRMHKVDGDTWFRGMTTYGFNRNKAWIVYDIPNSKNRNWDIGQVNKSGLRYLYSWETSALTTEVYKRPMYIDSKAYKFFLENEFPKKCIIAEIKPRYYTDLVSKIDDLNLDYILGTDRRIQKQIIKNFNGSDYLLTYQILMSIFNQVEYLGVAGAASLFSSVPAMNTMFISDNIYDDNVDINSIYFKTLLNKSIFGKETIGFFHARKILEFYRLDSFWMWESLKTILTSWKPTDKNPLIKINKHKIL